MEKKVILKKYKYRYDEDGSIKKTYTLKDEREFIDGLGKRDASGNMQWVERDGRMKPLRSRVWLLKKYYESLDNRIRFCKNVPEKKIRDMVREAIYMEGGSL